MSAATRPTPAGLPEAGQPWVVQPALTGAAGDPCPESDAGSRVRRSARDWWVDATAVGLSLLVGLWFLSDVVSGPDAPSHTWLVVDLVSGVTACLALWLRRRWPVGVAVLTAVIGALSVVATPAVLFSLFAVAIHRRWPTVLAVAVLNLATYGVYTVVRPTEEMSLPGSLALGMVITAAAVAWGMFVRARRQLVGSLRDRALRAEGEQVLRVEQARQLERTRIAREMHDVLAHRISLLSMHAGALEFRPDAPPAEVARAAGVVRESARQALEDLREVIGVLRDDPDGSVVARPQPTLADLPALLEESRRAGMRVRADYQVPDLSSAPAATGRNAYRVVQEGLTNVRKHAPGAVALVRVEGGPGAGLTVELRNPPWVGSQHLPLPGGGTGLVGLRERVTLGGGHLASGWTADGEFRLSVWLPWPA